MFDNEKLKAFLAHLIISCLVVLLLLYIVFYHWYPSGLIYAGGVEGLILIGGIDIVLGPLLTFVVYKKAKKGLMFDLSFIVLLQFSALSYGAWQLHSQKPMAGILMDDGVHLISFADTKKFDLDLSNFGYNHPLWLFMDLPENPETWAAIKQIGELADGKPFIFRQDLYKLSSETSKAEYRQRIKHISQYYSTGETTILNKAKSGCTWVPLHSIHTKGNICVDKKNGLLKLARPARQTQKV